MFENMSDPAMQAWAALNSAYGKSLNVNSAYRDPSHNAKVGGAKNSQHTHGNAFDIDVRGMSEQDRQTLARLALDSGFRGLGVYENSMHFDVGPARAWGPTYSKDSAPDWALAMVGQAGQPLTFGNQGPPVGHSWPGGGEYPAAPPEPAMGGLLAGLGDTLLDTEQPAPAPVQMAPMQASPIQYAQRNPMEQYLKFIQSMRV